jgi:thiamine-monophosphate kinase
MTDRSGAYSEAQVIARLSEIFASPDPRIEVGIGDDAAVVAGDKRQVMTTDMAVEGVHFRKDWSTGFEIGRKVTAANAADILAMGAKPDYLLVAVGLTGVEDMAWIEDLAHGIKFEADLAGMHVIGGDISRSERVVISMSAVGHCERAITRSGAQVGDGIFISSLTGWSAAGLAILQSQSAAKNDLEKLAVQEFKSPTIDYKFDSDQATAMCDVSDCIAEQAIQLANASGVELAFEENLIVKSPEFAGLRSVAIELNLDVWQWVFSGGEDHVLLATGRDLPGLRVGKVVNGDGVSGIKSSFKDGSWKHFN